MYKTNDVLVALQYRGNLSIGDERQRLGYAAFHWSILIQSTSMLHQFDVTDGIILDPETGQNLNKDENWTYRHTRREDTAEIARYLGAVRLGQLRKDQGMDGVQELLRKLPVPTKGSQPTENCVSWAASAIQALQDAGIIQAFEIPCLMDRALKFGDDRIAKFTETQETIDYVPRQARRTGCFSIFKRR